MTNPIKPVTERRSATVLHGFPSTRQGGLVRRARGTIEGAVVVTLIVTFTGFVPLNDVDEGETEQLDSVRAAGSAHVTCTISL
jgi:hypothetical protein